MYSVRTDEADVRDRNLPDGRSIEAVARSRFAINAMGELQMKRLSIWRRYGFAWVTGALFIFTLTGHWIFGWYAYANEQLALQQPVEIGDYTVQMMRDTLENWQSEFLQLLWQVAGLAILLHVGSPQSKEGDDRMEAKLDAILLAVEPKKGDKLLRDIDEEYEGRHTDARFVRMLEHGHSQASAHKAATGKDHD
jgi:hypothetical protein